MKLTRVRIENFQSVNDSNEFEIGNVTCLVGKNEAGKTALLRALYRLKPVRPAILPENWEGDRFDAEVDYPRQEHSEYEEKVESGELAPAEVVHATFQLSEADIDAVTKVFGARSLKGDSQCISLHKGYTNDIRFSGLEFDTNAAFESLVESAELSPPLTMQLKEQNSAEEMIATLQHSDEESDAISNLESILTQISGRDVEKYVYKNIIFGRIPSFLYFDEYYQLKGQDNLEAFKGRVESGSLEPADYPLLGLIELARLDLDQLANPERTQSLRSRLESAGNRLTRTVLSYWSQNQHLQMEFDVQIARPKDPPGMRDGNNLWGYIRDTQHNVSTTLGTRSRGFLWFFSFLAWYSHLRKGDDNLILLLDEPGLSLHAKAQADLLNYFEMELIPHHQLVYTTHSPFMVDPKRFERIRIVQDLSREKDQKDLPEDQIGTRVSTDVLAATQDSLFPLQGALGYEITQSLFLGPNCLVVEGVSDLLYIQTMSGVLQKQRRNGLSQRWTITPVGGAGNVSTFVALLGSQKKLNVAVLIDYHKRDRQKTEHLYKEKLLKKRQVLTYADFVTRNEADIEDMFDPTFYLELANCEYKLSLQETTLPMEGARITHRLDKFFEDFPLPGGIEFKHYRPARYFSENIATLESEISETVLDRFECMFKTLNGLLKL